MQEALVADAGTLRKALNERVRRFESWRDSRKTFPSLKRSLRWPFIPCDVVSKFGVPDKKATSSVALVHRGVVIKLHRTIAEEGVSVRSAAWGRVGFAGTIPGYGTTIVVDHGMGYHAVYAGFDELRVKEGDVVKPREAVGFFTPRNIQPKMVFELWKDGVPIDPVPWFS